MLVEEDTGRWKFSWRKAPASRAVFTFKTTASFLMPSERSRLVAKDSLLSQRTVDKWDCDISLCIYDLMDCGLLKYT